MIKNIFFLSIFIVLFLTINLSKSKESSRLKLTKIECILGSPKDQMIEIDDEKNIYNYNYKIHSLNTDLISSITKENNSIECSENYDILLYFSDKISNVNDLIFESNSKKYVATLINKSTIRIKNKHKPLMKRINQPSDFSQRKFGESLKLNFVNIKGTQKEKYEGIKEIVIHNNNFLLPQNSILARCPNKIDTSSKTNPDLNDYRCIYENKKSFGLNPWRNKN